MMPHDFRIALRALSDGLGATLNVMLLPQLRIAIIGVSYLMPPQADLLNVRVRSLRADTQGTVIEFRQRDTESFDEMKNIGLRSYLDGIFMVSYLTAIGVILAGIGAVLIGSNDLMSKKKALDLGQSRYSGGTDEENLKLPAVQELLRRSRNSSAGLVFVILGTIFLVLASLLVS
jgi:hypothetical protein